MGCGASSTSNQLSARQSQKHFEESPDNWTTLHSGARKTYESAEALEAEWEHGELLGEGVFARVELVTKRTAPYAGTTYACKSYGLVRYVDSRGEVWPEIDQGALEREINIMQGCGSEEHHVMQIYGVLEEPTKVHLVLEQCDMDLLRHVAANATCFPEKDAAIYSAQLLCAIAHIHSRSVMHCVEIEFRAPHAIDATCFRSCVCAMAWRLNAIDAMCSPRLCWLDSLTHWLMSAQVMHRNIKLEDLLLRSSGHHETAQICLGDFGHATAFIPGKLMKRPKNSPIYASPEEILVGEYDEKIDARRRRPTIKPSRWRRVDGVAEDLECRVWTAPRHRRDVGLITYRAQVWAAGVAVLALVGGLGDVDAASYKALHKGGVRGALALREHARSEPLVALLEDLLAHEAKDRASASEALRRHADWLANGPGEEFDEASSSHDREKRGSMSIHPTKGHCRRRSDFGAQARSLLARSDLQREVNRKIRQAPKKERDALAAAISADSLQRHAKHGGPCAHDQCCPGDEPTTPATAFRRCVQKVIVANRRRSADKLLDVLCRDDIMTCSQLEHVLEDLKKVHPEFHHFEDLEKAVKDCANRETILHIEISPLVRDHREFLNEQPRAVWKSKFHGAFVDLHAIDATPARWRGDAGYSRVPTLWLISTQAPRDGGGLAPRALRARAAGDHGRLGSRPLSGNDRTSS